MVEPTAFADTVTPPIFSPAAEVMLPARSASAKAAVGRRLPPMALASAITLTLAKCRVVVMAVLRGWTCQSDLRAAVVLRLRTVRRWYREGLVADGQCLEVRGDGRDLVG